MQSAKQLTWNMGTRDTVHGLVWGLGGIGTAKELVTFALAIIIRTRAIVEERRGSLTMLAICELLQHVRTSEAWTCRGSL